MSLQSIFCCDAAIPSLSLSDRKLHEDPNREIHEAIYQSFLAFTARRAGALKLLSLILGEEVGEATPLALNSPPAPIPFQPTRILTAEALKNNPIMPNSPYVMHLTSRHDFGPVISHRYFVCPEDLKQDWEEATLQQWFAVGEAFRLGAHKWDLKCIGDAKFYRLVLRPNLTMRTITFSAKEPASNTYHRGTTYWC